jgi:hypothetical protein
MEREGCSGARSSCQHLSARGPASHRLFSSVKHGGIEPKLLEALGAHLHSAAW